MFDFYIYLKHPEKFSLTNFEEYCNSMGFDIALYPAFELNKWDGGFVPIRYIDSRVNHNQNSNIFLTGFELFFERCDHLPPTLPSKSGYTHKISLRCGVADSFELLMAFLFGAYLIKMCEGVFEDPQSDELSDDFMELEATVGEILIELLDLSENGGLRTHCFNGWND